MHQIKLFNFPFAGGSKYSFRNFESLLMKKNIVSQSVELPGRGYRSDEALISNINELAQDLFQEIRHELQKPYAIYGHSMGTILGYLVAIKAMKMGLLAPKHLFFSGHEGPSIKKQRPFNHLLSKAEFIDKLSELGGCPDEILEDDALIGYFEPIIRSDFKAVETYEHTSSLLLKVPITVMIGSEEDISREEAQAWRKETAGTVEVIEFVGGHFFIYQHESTIAELISNRLNN